MEYYAAFGWGPSGWRSAIPFTRVASIPSGKHKTEWQNLIAAERPAALQKPKELSMELRLLLAFILMGVVLFVTPYFYKTVAPPPKKTDCGRRQESIRQPPPAVAARCPSRRPRPGSSAVRAAVRRLPRKKKISHVIDTELFQITFSNRGGVVKSWLLKSTPSIAARPSNWSIPPPIPIRPPLYSSPARSLPWT